MSFVSTSFSILAEEEDREEGGRGPSGREEG